MLAELEKPRLRRLGSRNIEDRGMLSLLRTHDPAATAHAYAYDGLGRGTDDAIMSGGGNLDLTVYKITRGYDAHPRLAKMSCIGKDGVGADKVMNEVALEYNVYGQLTDDIQEHADGAGVGSFRGGYLCHDRFGRIAETLWKDGAGTPAILQNAKYGYNRAGDRKWRQEVLATGQDNFYWYDDLHQVKAREMGDLDGTAPDYTGIQNPPVEEEDFCYDETGNWLRHDNKGMAGPDPLFQQRQHNRANEITTITNPSGVVQPAYDPAGNMTILPAPGDWDTALDATWDGWNRLVRLEDGSGIVARYAYDGISRRITADSGESTDVRHFYYNRKWRCVEEYLNDAADDEPDRRYAWNPMSRWQMILRQRSDSGTLDESLYPLYDAMDPVALVDETGAVQERYAYSAFGETTILQPNFSPRTGGSAFGWNLLHHVEFRDGDTGLYNYGFRYYHPGLGRWISSESLHSTNRFAFGMNNAVSLLDILGYIPLEQVWGNSQKNNKNNVMGGITSGTMNPCAPLHGTKPLPVSGYPEGVMTNGTQDHHSEEVQCDNGCKLTAEVHWAYEGKWPVRFPPGSMPENSEIAGVAIDATIQASGDGCCCEDGTAQLRQTVQNTLADGTPTERPRYDTPKNKNTPGFGTIDITDDRVNQYPFAWAGSSGPFLPWDTCSAIGHIIDNPSINPKIALAQGKNLQTCLLCVRKDTKKLQTLGCLNWGLRAAGLGEAKFSYGTKSGKPQLLSCGSK